MNRLKSFFIGILLLAATVAMVVLVALIYRADDQLSVKSYIFQTNDFATERVGALQKLEDMSAIELRNRLIKKYISEYFTVIPGEDDVLTRPDLIKMSNGNAYQQWKSGEAVNITEMSNKKMFRTVYVADTDITAKNMPDGYDYYNALEAEPIYYEIHYTTKTWTESNAMQISPIYETGDIYIEARFKPGIRKDIDIQKYLKSGENPLDLFMFEVTNIDDKE